MTPLAADPGRDPAVPVLPVVALVVAVAVAAGLINASFGGPGAPATVEVTVAGAPHGRPIPSGFLGLSLEYSALESYAGGNPADLDPVFEQLVRNLAPGQDPVVRIGGDSADWTWWPVPAMARPRGVTFTLDSHWLEVARALVQRLNARLLLGLNLEAGSSEVAATEAREMLAVLAPASIRAFELGNEPALYGTFAWYRSAGGRGVPGRPATYGFDAFLRDFTTVAARLPPAALAGPTTGGLGWMPYLSRFLDAAPRVRIVTVHRYPLQLCVTPRSSPRFPTIAHLLSPAASSGLAADFAGAVALAHSRGLPLRIDELNTVSCGAAPAVSQTFAAALWAVDALFELARAGVDGVNIHTFPGAGYELFAIHDGGGRWSASVSPEYYGLMLFAAAVPPGSQLLAVSGPARGRLKVWATLSPGRRLHVVLVNEDAAQERTVRLKLPLAAGAGRLDRLLAPGLSARTGTTLGGQSFGAQTTSGRLSGRFAATDVVPRDGTYAIAMPPASAALLTVGG